MTFTDCDPREIDHLRMRDNLYEIRERIRLAVAASKAEAPQHHDAIVFELAQAEQCVLRALILDNSSREKT
jgi:hypothetical protein